MYVANSSYFFLYYLNIVLILPYDLILKIPYNMRVCELEKSWILEDVANKKKKKNYFSKIQKKETKEICST